jgi:hypothetical protein
VAKYSKKTVNWAFELQDIARWVRSQKEKKGVIAHESSTQTAFAPVIERILGYDPTIYTRFALAQHIILSKNDATKILLLANDTGLRPGTPAWKDVARAICEQVAAAGKPMEELQIDVSRIVEAVNTTAVNESKQLLDTQKKKGTKVEDTHSEAIPQKSASHASESNDEPVTSIESTPIIERKRSFRRIQFIKDSTDIAGAHDEQTLPTKLSKEPKGGLQNSEPTIHTGIRPSVSRRMENRDSKSRFPMWVFKKTEDDAAQSETASTAKAELQMSDDAANSLDQTTSSKLDVASAPDNASTPALTSSTTSAEPSPLPTLSEQSASPVPGLGSAISSEESATSTQLPADSNQGPETSPEDLMTSTRQASSQPLEETVGLAKMASTTSPGESGTLTQQHTDQESIPAASLDELAISIQHLIEPEPASIIAPDEVAGSTQQLSSFSQEQASVTSSGDTDPTTQLQSGPESVSVASAGDSSISTHQQHEPEATLVSSQEESGSSIQQPLEPELSLATSEAESTLAAQQRPHGPESAPAIFHNESELSILQSPESELGKATPGEESITSTQEQSEPDSFPAISREKSESSAQ